jgi:hypothetical protein
VSLIDQAARYLAGADDPEASLDFEEHLFSDPEASRAAAWLLELRSSLVRSPPKAPPSPW